MKNPPYIPSKQLEKSAWATNFATIALASFATYGMTQPEAQSCQAAAAAYAAALEVATNPATRTPATIAAKNEKEADCIATLSVFAQRISLDSGISDDDKVAIGVTVRNTIRTPVTAPTVAPVLSHRSSSVGVAVLDYADPSTPNSKAVPANCVGVELFVSWGPQAPANPLAAPYAGRVTKSPFNLDTAGKKGQIAHVYARYVTGPGQSGKALVGPLSAPVEIVGV